MSAISGYISTIQNAVYGEQVRTAIVNALLACYSDVENPDLQSAAFQTAIENAYEDGILDIITVTSFNNMTNQNIIYRYNGTAAGKQKGLYYYSALSNSWVLIGSEIQKVSLASQMTDVNDIYKYIGTESGMVQNSLYCHNGTSWVPIGSGLLTAATVAAMTNTDAIYKYTGNESGMVQNSLYYYDGTAWVQVSNGIETDKTLTKENEPADSKAVGDVISGINGFTPAIKTALLNCFRNVAWISATGDAYIEALRAALYPEDSGLPVGYTKYDYVQNAVVGASAGDTNGPAFALGYGSELFSSDYEHEVIFTPIGAYTDNGPIYGLRKQQGSTANALNIWLQNGIAAVFGGMDSGYQAFSKGTKYTVRCTFDNGTAKVFINNSLIQSQAASGFTFEATGQAAAFGGTTAGALQQIRQFAKLYSIKVKKISTGETVKEFVPCTNTSGDAGLYEKVGGAFYTASVASKLSAGND